MALAITATSASPGPSSGVATSSRCRERRGSLSRVARSANISISSACTVTPRYESGTGSAAYSSEVVSPARIASRISFNVASRVAVGGLILPVGNWLGSLGVPAGRLHQFGQHPAAVLRVQERDGRPHGSPPRLV